MAGLQGQNQLTDFLRALRRRRWQVFVPAALVITLGASFAVIVPKKYRVTTRVEINSDAPSSPRWGGPEIAERREAASVADHIRNYARVKVVIDREMLMHLWPEYESANDRERDLFLRQVTYENLSAAPTTRDNKSGTIFIDIGFSDENPKRGERFLADLTQSWLEYVKESDRDSLIQERTQLQKLVDDQTTDLRKKDDDLYKLVDRLGKDPSAPTGNGRTEEAGDWTFRALAQARTDLIKTELALSGAKLESEQADLHFEAEQDEIEQVSEVEAQDLSSKIEEKKAELAALQEEIARYRPAHRPKYQQLEEKIAKATAEIEELEATETGSTEVRKTEKNPRKDEYRLLARQKKDRVDQLVKERELLQKNIADLETQTKMQTEGYQEYFNRKNEADQAREALNKTRADLREADKTLQMLDASPQAWRFAQQPLSSPTVTPNPWLIVAFSVFAGLALGMGLAVFSEYARSSYRTVGDLATVMSVPVLGAIETIVTRRELRRVHLSRAVAGLSTAVIVGSIGWVTWLWYSSPERLPLELQEAIERLRSALK